MRMRTRKSMRLQLVLRQILQRDNVHAIILNLVHTALALSLERGDEGIGGGQGGHAGDAAANRLGTQKVSIAARTRSIGCLLYTSPSPRDS